jgi:hypothetical protein
MKLMFTLVQSLYQLGLKLLLPPKNRLYSNISPKKVYMLAVFRAGSTCFSNDPIPVALAKRIQMLSCFPLKALLARENIT